MNVILLYFDKGYELLSDTACENEYVFFSGHNADGCMQCLYSILLAPFMLDGPLGPYATL